jgi:hypothetical protein
LTEQAARSTRVVKASTSTPNHSSEMIAEHRYIFGVSLAHQTPQLAIAQDFLFQMRVRGGSGATAAEVCLSAASVEAATLSRLCFRKWARLKIRTITLISRESPVGLHSRINKLGNRLFCQLYLDEIIG